MTPEQEAVDAEAIAALKELVRLRKLRDKINDGSASSIEVREYTKGKILAWHRAFLVVARLT